MSIINPSLAAFLLPGDKRPRCVSVSYDRIKGAVKGQDAGSDIKSFKTFDRALAKGDLVIVPTDTRWGFTVGRVEDVDLIVNYSSPEQMRWIAGRMDKPAYDRIIENEKHLTGTVAKATEEKARRELMDEMLAIDSNFANLSLTGPPSGDAPAVEPPHRGGEQSRFRRQPAEPRNPDDDIPF